MSRHILNILVTLTISVAIFLSPSLTMPAHAFDHRNWGPVQLAFLLLPVLTAITVYWRLHKASLRLFHIIIASALATIGNFTAIPMITGLVIAPIALVLWILDFKSPPLITITQILLIGLPVSLCVAGSIVIADLIKTHYVNALQS